MQLDSHVNFFFQHTPRPFSIRDWGSADAEGQLYTLVFFFFLPVYIADFDICCVWCVVSPETKSWRHQGTTKFWEIRSFTGILAAHGSYPLAPTLLFKVNCSLHWLSGFFSLIFISLTQLYSSIQYLPIHRQIQNKFTI